MGSSAVIRLLLHSVLIVLIGSEADTDCYEVTSIKTPPYFVINQTNLGSLAIIVKFPKSRNSCTLKAEDIFQFEKETNSARIRVFAFVCLQPQTVYIAEGNTTYMPEIISYAEIFNCTFSLDGLQQIADTTDLKVVNVINSNMLTTNLTNLCRSLNEISTLTIKNLGNISMNLSDLYSCGKSINTIAEIILQNMFISEIPSSFSTVMPNLQALDLSRNNLTRPPAFPWKESCVPLPRNLSRSVYFQSHYNFGVTLDIPPNVYRREYRLDYNKNLDIRNFKFKGLLHIISIKGCNLKELNSTMFHQVRGLQFLDLSKNQFAHLPSQLFLKTPGLRKLELSNNNISRIENGTFGKLNKLLRLSLTNNRIEFLQDGVFHGLDKLEKIWLDNNRISYISKYAFSRSSTSLKTVYLNQNPLKSFPVGLLLLRSLYEVDLKGSVITEINFVEINKNVNGEELAHTVVDSASSSSPDLDSIKEGQRVIDLTGGKVRSIIFQRSDKESNVKTFLILKHFKIILDENPISCDCKILSISRFSQELIHNKSLTGDEYCFTGWSCAEPKELKGQYLLSVNPNATYCPVLINGCPVKCNCYRRSGIGTVIVDCRNAGLDHFPETLPNHTLELWLQGNKIKHLVIPSNIVYIKSLLLSGNGLQVIDGKSLSKLKILRELHIDNNLLSQLPRSIASMNVDHLRIGNNPYQCDCNLKWMKHWILRQRKNIDDGNDIKCVNSVSDEGIEVTAVPEEDFVCESVSKHVKRIAIAVSVSTLFFLLVLVSIVSVVLKWQDVKVFLYLHTGLHPFDLQDPPGTKSYDVFFYYPGRLREWAHKDVVHYVENMQNYTVFDVVRDFRFGFSYMDNVKYGILRSKRLVMVLTEESESDNLSNHIFDAGLEKSKKDKTNFLVLLIHDCLPQKSENENIQRYIRNKRYITTSQRNFLKKLLYHLPRVPVAGISKISKRSNMELTHTSLQCGHVIVDSRRSSEPCGLKVRDIQSNVNPNMNTKDQGNQGTNTKDKSTAENENFEKFRINKTISCQEHSAGSYEGQVLPHQYSSELNQCMFVSDFEHNSGVFVWYSDTDFTFMMQNIINPFEALGYSFILADKNFIPGGAVQENILCAIKGSFRTIIVLSSESIQDEWLLYVFRFAYERQMKEKTYAVGLVLRGEPDWSKADDEIAREVQTSVTLVEDDQWFHRKLEIFLDSSLSLYLQSLDSDSYASEDANQHESESIPSTDVRSVTHL